VIHIVIEVNPPIAIPPLIFHSDNISYKTEVTNAKDFITCRLRSRDPITRL